MKLSEVLTVFGSLALLGAAIAPAARASDWNKKTTFTFSGPVEIPGVHLTGFAILPAGTYVFKILDSQSDRHIVQIFNKEETQIFATILAIPNYRLKATDKTVMMFRERGAGQPEALRAWFYPGANFGEEFVYPKARAMAMAKATDTPVLYTSGDFPVEVATGDVGAYQPMVAEFQRAPVMASAPSGEDMPLAQVVTPPPAMVETVAAQRTAPAVLPGTASLTPAIGLAGLLFLAAGFGLWSVRKRIAA